MPLTRREILRTAIGSALATPLLSSIASAQTSKSATTSATTKVTTRGATTLTASDRPRIACIGVGGQGKSLGRQIVKYADVSWVCDVDKTRADAFNAERCAGKASVTGDYRTILEKKDVDGVIIATPDHWHTKIAIDAMRAGKDVYCEKPLTLTIDEGRILAQVVRETGRVFQVGTQQRSDEHWQKCIAMVQGGWLGKINRVTCVIMKNVQGGPFKQTEAPKEIDWNEWQGQTPDVPYIKERSHYTFRWWYEYSGGRMTDWGAHYVDIAQWAAAPDLPGPTEIVPLEISHPVKMRHGMPQVHDVYNTANRFKIACKFANGVEIVVTDQIPGLPQQPPTVTKSELNGILFEGTEKTLFINRQIAQGNVMETLKDRPIPPAMLAAIRNGRDTMPHMLNWVVCMKDRGTPISDVFSHNKHLNTCHLANIAGRLNRSIKWDATKQQIVGDSEANQFLSRPQRKGFEIA